MFTIFVELLTLKYIHNLNLFDLLLLIQNFYIVIVKEKVNGIKLNQILAKPICLSDLN